MKQPPDLTLKKRPQQERAKATFDAIVEACARLLPRLGYAGVTTNHVAREAGVGIASLYEYFPGKDAIVAVVAERLVERVIARLGRHVDELLASDDPDPVQRWIERIHATLALEKDLVAVFVYEIPYTNQLEPFRKSREVFVSFSELARQKAGKRVKLEEPEASLYLMFNLVSTTILQLLLDPPKDVPTDTMIRALSRRIARWIEGG